MICTALCTANSSHLKSTSGIRKKVEDFKKFRFKNVTLTVLFLTFLPIFELSRFLFFQCESNIS